MSDLLLNPGAKRILDLESSLPDVRRFHQRMPGYQPTPLVDLPELARELGVKRVVVKDESNRLGLPAFKILGASWALYRLLERELSLTLDDWDSFDRLVDYTSRELRGVTLLTATDGNHGRAVARLGKLFRLPARVYMPSHTAPERVRAIEGEGAKAVLVDGTYDDSVAAARTAADDLAGWLLQDNSWPGYEEIPAWVAQGYATMTLEIDEQLGAPPDVVLAPVGVGTFAARITLHYRSGAHEPAPTIVCVEPTRAACALESVRAGRPLTLDQQEHSIMAGLDCPTPASLALPVLAAGADAFIAIEDDRAHDAMRRLAREGVESGESGAASAAGLVALAREHPEARSALSLTPRSTILTISTEGATDRDAWERIIGGLEATPSA